MKYFLGLVIIGLYFIFIDSYFLVAILTILTVFIIGKHKFRENQIAESIGQLVIKLFVMAMVVFIIAFFLFMKGEKDSLKNNKPSISKELKIAIKDNQPCFYIDEFDGIDNYEIEAISVNTAMPSEKLLNKKSMWNGEVDRKDIYSMKPFRLSAISDVSKCIPYGIKNDITSAPSQKLKTDVLYEVYMDGVKRSVNKDKDRKYGIWLYGTFYLSRNLKTGKLEVNMLNNAEINIWFNKIKDQNKSIQVK